MRKNPTYIALLGPTRLLISEKSATYTIKWSYTIIWQVRVLSKIFIISAAYSEYINFMVIYGFHDMLLGGQMTLFEVL